MTSLRAKEILFGLTLAAVAVIGIAGNAQAASPVIETHVNTVRATGVRVYWPSSHHLCNERVTLMGFYDYNSRSLHVCDRGDALEQMDTYKHELIHAVQHCKGGPIMGSNLSRYFPQLTALGYPRQQLHTESEARVLSNLPVQGLTRMVAEYCLTR